MNATYLTVDRGNTEAKLSLRHDGRVVRTSAVAEVTPEVLSGFTAGTTVDAAIAAATSGDDSRLLRALESVSRRAMILRHDTPMPVTIGYSTPSTLGTDRIAAAAGAAALMPGRGVLVVDAGTAATMDYIDPEGCFRGGNISAGVTMQLRAMHDFTARLPLLPCPADEELDGTIFGTDTASAMLSGAVTAIAGAAEYMLRRLPADTAMIVTGGNATLVARHIIPQPAVEPRLVDYGLYRILLYNENK